MEEALKKVSKERGRGKAGKRNGRIFVGKRKEAEGRGNKLKGGTEREKRGHLFLGNFEGNGRKVKGAGKRKELLKKKENRLEQGMEF